MINSWFDRKNFPHLEDALKDILEKGERNSELEKVIAKHPNYAVVYAKKVIHGRFLSAEQNIANSPYYVCAYLSELELKSVPEIIHRVMLSNAIKENLDDDKNYWIKQYFNFCDYLEGKGLPPWWLSKESLNWNYGQGSLNWNCEKN